MNLYIDGQILQTSDASRGMGLYLSSILKHVTGSSNKDNQSIINIVIILNPRLGSLINTKSNISKILPNAQFIDLDLAFKSDDSLTYGKFSSGNKKVVSDALKESSDGDVFFIPALYSNDIFPVFPNGNSIKKVVLFHDLIPYLYSKQYFPSHDSSRCLDYCERFRSLFEADLILTNSQTTADDLSCHFGISENRLIPIFGGGADRSKLTPKKPVIAKRLGKRFVLMPSGDDIRKNNQRGVQAFHKAAERLGDDVVMVITSNFSDGTKRELNNISNRIVFAGNVSDEEYLWLTKNSELVFFPTEYEGLGMPLIETAELNIRVVCSNIAVHNEISRTGFTFCDPLSVSSMSDALYNELKPGSGHQIDKQEYKNIEYNFNWYRSASLFRDAIKAKIPVASESKKRIAIFAPSVDSYSAIGKYALETHAELSRIYEIDYYFDNGHTPFEPTRLNILSHAANSYSAASFSSPDKYDAVIYHIGNSEFHINAIYNALRYPGTIILHDCKLNGIFDYMLRGGYITQDRYDAEGFLTQEMANGKSSHIVSLVTRSKSVICHSKYVQKVVCEIDGINESKVYRIDHPIGTPKKRINQNSKKDLIVSFAGIISRDKGIDSIKNIAALSDKIKVRLFGFGVLDTDTNFDSYKNVTVLKDLTDLEFQNQLSSSDILVNFRARYNGETSRSALEAMRYGVAVVVNDIGWFSELPNDSVIKASLATEVPDIIEQIVKTNNRTLISGTGSKAVEYTKGYLGFQEYTKKIQEVINNG